MNVGGAKSEDWSQEELFGADKTRSNASVSKEALMVDTNADIDGGKAAGMYTVLFI